MDRLGVKKKLYAGMGDFARGRRIEELRKRHRTGNANLDAVADSQDAAVEGASLPSTPAVSVTIAEGVKDVASNADKWGEENRAALDDALGAMSEDEEMAKWMAKQGKG